MCLQNPTVTTGLWHDILYYPILFHPGAFNGKVCTYSPWPGAISCGTGPAAHICALAYQQSNALGLTCNLTPVETSPGKQWPNYRATNKGPTGLVNHPMTRQVTFPWPTMEPAHKGDTDLFTPIRHCGLPVSKTRNVMLLVSLC